MTNEKCPSCGSCGMPMKDLHDYALGNKNSIYCSHCTDEKGILRSYEEVLQLTINFYMQTQGIHAGAAKEMAIKLLSTKLAWKREG